jgi:hypothetical protein
MDNSSFLQWHGFGFPCGICVVVDVILFVVVVDSASKRREQTDLGASSEVVLWTTGKGRRFGLHARCVVSLAVVGE